MAEGSRVQAFSVCYAIDAIDAIETMRAHAGSLYLHWRIRAGIRTPPEEAAQSYE